MIRSIIIDDEADGREMLEMALTKYCPEFTIVGTYENARDGLQAIQQLKPEVVFLDIQMPYMSGFDLLEQLESVTFEVIFVTAYDKYAIKAIKFSALDYLLKPIDVDELLQATRRATAKLHSKDRDFRCQSVIANAKNNGVKIEKLAIPTLEGIVFLQTEDIIYLRADGNYTSVYQRNKQHILVSKKLKDFENILSNSGFCRVHHTYLINLMHVEKYIRGEGGYVVLDEGHHVDVSRRKKEEFLKLIDKV